MLHTAIVAAYDTDPFCVALKKVLSLREDSTIVDNLMFVDGQLVIPNTHSIQKNLINKEHIRLGHLGFIKTLTELHRKFFWTHMSRDVKNASKVCTTLPLTLLDH
ncbi:hypothetical protein PCASD_02817 [Puccinia coronata f. sp. avenae]|uniref:Integrase zinc-binding domain-containing protein n=1 Tax=Puccinia coronata f. sp. avenae TaxID=200324 RepID=A0A2N5VFS2_9BASI|nr:hypothetical protein PCASD_02817 [Puccinia coronata f. sp. avenae]